VRSIIHPWDTKAFPMPLKRVHTKFEGGEEYEGQVSSSSNLPQGFGRATSKSGSKYSGTWLDGQVCALALFVLTSVLSFLSTALLFVDTRTLQSACPCHNLIADCLH
jgi:hypothetical protein